MSLLDRVLVGIVLTALVVLAWLGPLPVELL